MASPEKPILFHYPQSIYSHRVLWYLWLRGIAYDECIQPPIMPRPDLAALDVQYRRIPIMAIGKDVYCDSRCIIQALERRFPESKLTPASAAEKGIRKLFESWTIDGGIFTNSVKCTPYWKSGSLFANSAFVDDREKLAFGRRLTAELMEKNRPDGLQHMRQAFEMMEDTFLADGRKWVLGTDEPITADIDGVWPIQWVAVDPYMKGALAEESINDAKYPKTFGWARRFVDFVHAKKAQGPKPTSLKGDAVKDRIMHGSTEPTTIDSDDVLQLQEGQEIEVYASDYGSTHKDHGPLIGLTTTEVTIRNSQGFHIHFPRWNFRIDKIQTKSSIPASISPPKNKIPNLRLIYHHASPYTRKVYIHAQELNLASHLSLQKVVVCPIPFPGWSDNNEDVAVYNPMAKIPCLVSDDVPGGLYDSRVICEYLSELAGVSQRKDGRYWQLRALHACADGIMDAMVLLVYEIRIRTPRGLKLEEWVEGQKTKIFRALDRLEVAVKEGVLGDSPKEGFASADESAVVAAVGSVDQMSIEWREGREKLAKWYEKWSARRSVLAAPADRDWESGSEVKASSKI